MSKISIVTELLDNIVGYFTQYSALANFHMVDYFTKDGFKKHFPNELLNELNDKTYDHVIEHIFDVQKHDLPQLDEYLDNSRNYTLKNCSDCCLTMEKFQMQLQQWGCQKFSRFKLPIFMTSKKSHEVDVVSFVAAAIKTISNTSHLIDIGDGKGYLSSMLALYYNIPVMGVDASAINTNSSVDRVRKLSRVWKSVANNQNDIEVGLYKQITQYVDERIDFTELVSTVFLEKPTSIGLVGLHTCGNLAANSLKIFNTCTDIKTICNIGCCYHLIDEKFAHDSSQCKSGFPMSAHLRNKKLHLGRAARMMAAQSIERILQKKELPSRTIFYRALFEVLIEQNCPHVPKDKRTVGKFRKGSSSFIEYVRKASKRINLTESSISDMDIENVYSCYADREKEMYVFLLIRNMLAPVIESVILLDRLLFLLENGYENSFLVHLFDPVVSPRCYGVISVK